MAISYHGHSALEIAETDRLLAELRLALPDETWSAIRLSAARPLPEPFGAEIASGFGIAARSRFTFTLIDMERAHNYRPALIAAAYILFGRGRLVITWELDSIVPPPDDLLP